MTHCSKRIIHAEMLSQKDKMSKHKSQDKTRDSMPYESDDLTGPLEGERKRARERERERERDI